MKAILNIRDLLFHDALCLPCLMAALFNVLVDDSFQGVDVVERDALDFLNIRVDVTRHGDVDEKELPALALCHQTLCLPRLDHVMRRPR